MILNALLENGITAVLKTAARFYLGGQKGRIFIEEAVPAIKRSAKKRREREKAGQHVPPFLIASIASNCNLYCTGCYARAGGLCSAETSRKELTAKEWDHFFTEASDFGISFILLAGGEPLLRRDILEAAAKHRGLIFPVFTNGTLLDDAMISFFDHHRNLIPVISLEGSKDETDFRRGNGAYARVTAAMEQLKQKEMLYGVSITVSSRNLSEIMEPRFAAELRDAGCGIVFFVEYVPAEEGTEHLVLSEAEVSVLADYTSGLKKKMDDMIVISFPGDEEAMGGCLAAGRGFFHINPAGNAEPCPFSLHSVQNITESSIESILESRFFSGIRCIACGDSEHRGGCTLFHKRDEVSAIMKP